MRPLPPLSALRVFEVAARTGSYAAAAVELGVTHGAVSRQIAILEAALGRRLFVRDGRRMVATPMAATLAAEIGGAFDRIAAAVETSGRPGARRVLRVSAPTSFAMRWLIPRTDRFHDEFPQVELSVSTVATAADAMGAGIDVAIRRGSAGTGAWPGCRVVPVLENWDTLIVSPRLFARQPIRVPADIAAHTLLGSETRGGDWVDWMHAADLPHLLSRPRRVFDHFFVCCRAVEDGLGLGIGPLPMLSRDIAEGRLLAPLPEIGVRRAGYVAIHPTKGGAGRIADAFLDWLAAEAAASPGSAPP